MAFYVAEGKNKIGHIEAHHLIVVLVLAYYNMGTIESVNHFFQEPVTIVCLWLELIGICILVSRTRPLSIIVVE